MRIAVCDDELIYQKAITDAIDHWSKRRAFSAVIVCCFQSTEELLSAMERQPRFDIVFLDIQIPSEMSGLDMARRIRLFDECTQIVFVTNFSEYACEGYQVGALRYLCKPVHADGIEECLDIAYRQWRLMQGSNIVLNSRIGKYVLTHKDIFYIEACGHDLLIHRSLDQKPLTFRMTLNNLYDQLPHDLFVKCHRSFLVNILYIRRITREVITMADGQEISVGKHYRDLVGTTFDRYYQGINV